jgi:phage tail-like protein
MRNAVDGLLSPFPLGEQLPSVYAEDEMAQRFTAALDDLFAPLLAVLDCMEAYFHPGLAPADFVAWLGGWVGAEVTGQEPEQVLREVVAGTAALHRRRGTAHAIAEAIRLTFGVVPELEESGGSTWSAHPLGPFPGHPNPSLTVRLRVPDPDRINQARLEELVGSLRPAHIPFSIKILQEDGDN